MRLGEAQIYIQSSKENFEIVFFFDILTMFFLRPEIYLQMGLFLIFMYFTIILERFATKLHHMQLEP